MPVRTLPRAIVVLGVVSLLTDISSELVHSLLPIYMTAVLGASFVTVGLVEGIAEATASVAKVFSGMLSDRLGNRKWLAVVGYGLSAATKPLFPLATSVASVFTGRFLDRMGKGIRGSPRDALVSEIAPPELRGAAFGLRQALDSVGACVGPLLAIVLMVWWRGDVRAVLWIAVVPALAAVALLAIGVREPDRTAAGQNVPSVTRSARLPRACWMVLAIAFVFSLARFSEAFLILRGQDAGMTAGSAPMVMVVMNVIYAAVAYPAGAAADRIDKRKLLAVGLAILIAADVVLALAVAPRDVLAGAALWGLHMACTQGLLSKMVADSSPDDLRGTAFGLFHLTTGGAMLAASVIAGAVWSRHGAPATFLTGGAFAAAAMIVLLRPPTKLILHFTVD